jgi:ethanolamine utilization microcompartment shell protein EutL
MSAKTEDVEGAIRRIEARSRADKFQWARAVRTADLHTLLVSHAALTADLDTAENALVSQTALVRAQAERIASLEAGLEKARVSIACYSPDPTEPLQEIEALLSGKDSA